MAPAAARNAAVISAALVRLLAGGAGTVLEVGAGTGQHAVACAAALPHLRWLPSDPDPRHRASIAAWAAEAGAPNLAPPIALDLLAAWPAIGPPNEPPNQPLRAVFCANVIHITPWAVAEGLAAGAARVLGPGGLLILYGPFAEADATTPGNRAFHADLRARNPDWGVRELAEVAALTARHGFGPPERVEMPAGNLILAFARAPLGAGPAAG